MADSSNSLLMPVEAEFVEGINVSLRPGVFGDFKRSLIPFALEVIRAGLLDHIHPLEALRGLTDLQYENLLENPDTPSLLSRLLDELEANPNLQDLLAMLRQSEVMERLRVDWLHERTVGRYEHTIPFLHKEEELLKDWEGFCLTCRDSSINPFTLAEEQARHALTSRSTQAEQSEPARSLFRLSFLAACRKLFVFFSGARETWIGSSTVEEFEMGAALTSLLGGKDDAGNGGHLSLRFGLVEHVFYLKPTVEQISRYAECVKQPDFILSIQRRLCPFVASAEETLNSNLLAEVFLRLYQPQRLRELHGMAAAPEDSGFLKRTGMTAALFGQLGFVPMSEETVCFFTSQIDSIPRLRSFLRNPCAEAGLLRQRLYRGILDRLLVTVLQEALLSLCRQWNPLIRTPDGSTLSLMACAEARACRMTRCELVDSGAEMFRQRQTFEELLPFLTQNTQQWQREMERDSFVVDRSRHYFMTVLDKATDESCSEKLRCGHICEGNRTANAVTD